MEKIIGELYKLLSEFDNLDGKTVINNSVQVGNTKEQLLPLSHRLSKNAKDAHIRGYLEATQRGEDTPQDETIDDKIIETWVDDIIIRTLDKVFRE